MTRKHRNESSEDDDGEKKKNSRSRRSRHERRSEDDSDSSDSDQKKRRRDKDSRRRSVKESNGTSDEERERGGRDRERKDRYERASDEDGRLEREKGKRVRERSDRYEHDSERGRRDRERNDRYEQGSDGDDGRVERERGKRDRERKDRHEQGTDRDDGRVDRERGKRDRERKDIHEQGSDGDDGRVEKGRGKRDVEIEDRGENGHPRKGEREDVTEKGHRKREAEEKHKDKDRHFGHDMVDEDDRQRNRYIDEVDDDDRYRRRRGERTDGDRKQRREREGNEGREDSRSLREKEKEKDGDGKVNEHLKSQKPLAMPGGGNPNADSANLGRSGGVYIPPFKLARMMKEVEDKSSVEYQRLTWDALRKSINGLVNKVNATNIKNIIPELFAENLIRGRGLFCRSCMKSQMASPGFTDVFAALVAVVNTKFPEIGELLLRRIILQLKRAYKRNDKPQLLAAVKFIAHLVNQQVVHELVALELLTLLLDKPTDDSVEVAVGFVTECGSILQDLCPEACMGYPAVRPELDLVEQEDQLTHEISLQEEEIDAEITLDIFKPDSQFSENEKQYEGLKKTILGDDSEDEADSDAGSGDDDDDDNDEEEESDEEDEEQMKIKDETETNLVNLRRTIYLTIMSSVDFEEAGHKLLKIKLEPGQEMELCIMLLECCSQERTYLRYYGLLGQRFCMINKVHQENFEKCFVQQYSMIHRLETNKLRNVAKFFAHLLGTDALPWHVLAYIRLTEEDTTSSSRIFIKILFQELSEHLGIRLLNERLSEPTMQDSFESIFPRDNPKNTRFSINFFTSIGLGGITENLREYLKNMPRLIMQQQKPVSESDEESGGSGSSDSDASSSASDARSSSPDDESESDNDERRKKRRRR
ncbi:MIF4G domain-containing protein [Actinidia rufa]|uniref:MIF4G domain-containing protein n=1 Tax=Actinidia rufa TaxID=165716 RepID=A0A7J0DQA2_9ERIC|nr:MIF4G domain-containing protein [Actinidia rufa]